MNVKHYLFAILSVLFCAKGYAQINCGSLYATTQSELDQFFNDNPDCTALESVILEFHEFPGAISDLSGFSGISEITVGLEIYNYISVPTDLSPFLSLTNLNSAYFRNVIDFDGFSNLTSIESFLTIQYNADYIEVPMDLSGFDNLESAGTIDLAIVDPYGSYVNVFPSLTSTNGINLGNSIGFMGSPWGMNVMELTGFNALQTLNGLLVGMTGLGEGVFIETLSICPLVLSMMSIQMDYLSTTNWNSFGSLTNIGEISTLIFGTGNTIIQFPNLETIGTLFLWLESYEYLTYDFQSLTTVNSVLLWEGSSNGQIEINAPVWSSVLSNFEIGTFSSDFEPFGVPTLHHFESLNSIEGNLSILYTNIEDLSFFTNLSAVGGSIQISGNPYLAMCNIEAVCQKLDIAPASVVIENNNDGCLNQEQVILQCAGASISGQIYADLNCNDFWDLDETVVAYPIVLDVVNNSAALVSNNGLYALEALPSSMYQLQVANMPGFLPSNVVTLNTASVLQSYPNNHIGICPDFSYNDVSVDMTSTPLNPGFTETISIYLSNASINWAQADLTVTLPNASQVTFVSSNLDSNLDGEVLSINNIGLLAFQTMVVELQVVLNPTVSVGSSLVFSANASLTSASDLDVSNNVVIHAGIVTGSFDPNDITVNRSAINMDSYDNQGEWLTYQIRFQNTGNAPAQFISVVNEQSDLLDLSSIQMIYASHPASWTFNDREVTWYFDDIQLPDSLSDPMGSQGTIVFKIKTNPGILLEDIVSSTAAIYFDFNEPVITNTANTIWYECPSSILTTTGAQLCFDDSLTISANNAWSTISWYLDDVFLSAENTIDVSGSNTGEHIIRVVAETAYCQTDEQFTLVCTPALSAPAITQQNNVLTVEDLPGLQWFLNGELVASEVASIMISESGIYSVLSSLDNCSVLSLPFEASLCPELPDWDLTAPNYCTNANIEIQVVGNYASYQWFVDESEVGTGASLNHNFPNAGTYTISLLATDGVCSANLVASVVVTQTPEMPTITQDGNVLMAQGTGDFSWYFNGVLLPSVGNTITMEQSGDYGVSATVGNCVSELQTDYFVYAAISENQLYDVLVFPIPANEVLYVATTHYLNGHFQIRAMDGRLVYENKISQSMTSIDVSAFAKGCYFMLCTHSDRENDFVSKFFVE